jgi:hypothetical protein
MLSSRRDSDRLLAVYLNDHFAGATGGVELARRLRSSSEADEMGRPLAEVCAEIEADRSILGELMKRLEIRRSIVKPPLAWAGEKLGRLKLNGRLTRSSPLSRMLELEMLYIGITGKMQLWKALQQALGESVEGFDFGQLEERAARQRAVVGDLHRSAATVLAGSPRVLKPD